MIQRQTKTKKSCICCSFNIEGKSHDFILALCHFKAPCSPVLTLLKLKTTLPSLKAVVDIGSIIYRISCSCCNTCYVGQIDQYILTRFKEHKRTSQTYCKHISLCGTNPHSIDSSKSYSQQIKASYDQRLWKLYGRGN